MGFLCSRIVAYNIVSPLKVIEDNMNDLRHEKRTDPTTADGCPCFQQFHIGQSKGANPTT